MLKNPDLDWFSQHLDKTQGNCTLTRQRSHNDNITQNITNKKQWNSITPKFIHQISKILTNPLMITISFFKYSVASLITKINIGGYERYNS